MLISITTRSETQFGSTMAETANTLICYCSSTVSIGVISAFALTCTRLLQPSSGHRRFRGPNAAHRVASCAGPDEPPRPGAGWCRDTSGTQAPIADYVSYWRREAAAYHGSASTKGLRSVTTIVASPGPIMRSAPRTRGMRAAYCPHSRDPIESGVFTAAYAGGTWEGRLRPASMAKWPTTTC